MYFYLPDVSGVYFASSFVLLHHRGCKSILYCGVLNTKILDDALLALDAFNVSNDWVVKSSGGHDERVKKETRKR